METLKWSRTQIGSEFSNCQSLSEMITQVEDHLRSASQVVCQVKVNDLVLTDHDEVKFAATKLEDIETLEISYRDSEFLLRDSTHLLKSWLEEFKTAVVATADKMRSAEVTATAYTFSKVVANAEWFIEALQAVKSHISPTPEWAECEARFIAALKELESGYRAQDSILVADVLEYEVSTCLDQWQEILSKVAAA